MLTDAILRRIIKVSGVSLLISLVLSMLVGCSVQHPPVSQPVERICQSFERHHAGWTLCYRDSTGLEACLILDSPVLEWDTGLPASSSDLIGRWFEWHENTGKLIILGGPPVRRGVCDGWAYNSHGAWVLAYHDGPLHGTLVFFSPQVYLDGVQVWAVNADERLRGLPFVWQIGTNVILFRSGK